MPKKKAKTTSSRAKLKSAGKKELGYTPRPGNHPKLPPVSGKTGLKKGEEDYGQSVVNGEKPHLSLAELSRIVLKMTCESKLKPEQVKIYMEGSQYWGQLSEFRFFDEGKAILLMKRN